MGNPIDLSKKVQIVLEKKQLVNVQAQVKVMVDTSYSMSGNFKQGVMQEVIDRLVALGLKMDANQSIEVYGFNNSSTYIGEANLQNHEQFVENVFLNKTQVSGGTSYAPVMKQGIEDVGAVVNVVEEVPSTKFFGKLFGKTDSVVKETVVEAQEHPTIIFFITDGDNSDKTEARKIIQESSNQGIFWQFVGIGNERFTFLQELDEMPGRFIDNANFFQVNDIARISDEELYERLLTEFPLWLKEAKAKNLVK